MSDANAPAERRRTDRPQGSTKGRGRGSDELFAALDLGTNNCRLLVAARTREGFRVVDSYSRIVRLGEGLTQTGRLQQNAMDRALEALKVCAERLERRGSPKLRAVATQACRSAENGAEFLTRVAAETGLTLEIIPPREEARLSVAGCLNLLDRGAEAALVLDVGGGSTELSWVTLPGATGDGVSSMVMPPIRAWLSVPIGVVSLAENFPEQRPGHHDWFRAMVEAVKTPIAAFRHADAMRPVFDADRAHLIGTSGAITSLAGLHLGLKRYDRAQVDGLWMSQGDCHATAEKLLALDVAGRAEQPCIGPDRADLVLAGAAILQAVQELWPCSRVRVADRGLREGLLLSLMAERGARRRTRRRRRGGTARAVVTA